MKSFTGFVAYPSRPPQIGQAVKAALTILRSSNAPGSFQSWEESDIAGRFLVEPILANIEGSDVLVADITRLNFNVVFEIGYAIGIGKRSYLIRNSALELSEELTRDVGIFDTLGFVEYSNSPELANLLEAIDPTPIPLSGYQIDAAAPAYIVLPRTKTDAEIRLVSRIKKARVHFRSFDPEEQGRLSAGDAIENVAKSHGVVISLLPKERHGADTHNCRAAFVAGLAMAMRRELLLMQEGEDPVPLDYRDLVSPFRFPNQIDQYVNDFSIAIGARFQASAPRVVAQPTTFLSRLNLGASAAENELQELGQYYLETDEYRRAIRGEVRIVTGRKGAGKTALFAQLRDKVRQDRSRVVLDLKPEGFQLLKLRERVLDFLEEGTKEHTVTAFWEYLLLLETCHKILEKDKQTHMRDHRLYEPYRALAESYFEDEQATEGDFSERMLLLMQRLSDDFDETHPKVGERLRLTSAEVTQLLHKHDVSTLRERVAEYLQFKNGLWILFDNLDKGWPAHGVTSDDVQTLRSLIEAMSKIERDLKKRKVECHGVVFIRNDVYELLVANTADRGKVPTVTLDWTDPELLREVLRRRFVSTGVEGNPTFDEIWLQIAATHIQGEETSQFLLDRSLMRPRGLIELLRYCRSHAVNMGHTRIELIDFEQGEEAYSSEVLNNVSYEIRDVAPDAGDLLYDFIESITPLTGTQIKSIIAARVGEQRWEKLFYLLVWYGFLGLQRESGEISYIYSVKYDMKRLQALIERKGIETALFEINPAFWRSLEIHRKS